MDRVCGGFQHVALVRAEDAWAHDERRRQDPDLLNSLQCDGFSAARMWLMPLLRAALPSDTKSLLRRHLAPVQTLRARIAG